jgi:hypothetical protein
MLQFFRDRTMPASGGARRGSRELPIDEETLVQKFGQDMFEAARRSGFIRPKDRGSNEYLLSTWDERVMVYRAMLQPGGRNADARQPAPTATAAPQRAPAPAPLTHRPFEKLQVHAEQADS